MTEYACPRRELSCIVGNLFVELEPPCDHCAAGDSLTICGTTYACLLYTSDAADDN